MIGHCLAAMLAGVAIIKWKCALYIYVVKQLNAVFVIYPFVPAWGTSVQFFLEVCRVVYTVLQYLFILNTHYTIVLKFNINMYALVKFYDDVYYVCKSNRIITTKNVTKAIYSDKRSYAATILAKNGKLNILCFTSLLYITACS